MDIMDIFEDFGLYKLLYSIGTALARKMIDKDPGLKALTDKLADGATLVEALTAYAEATPNVNDDEIPEFANSVISEIRDAVNRLETESFISVITSIKVKDKAIGDIEIPLDGDDHKTIRELIIDILR